VNVVDVSGIGKADIMQMSGRVNLANVFGRDITIKTSMRGPMKEKPQRRRCDAWTRRTARTIRAGRLSKGSRSDRCRNWTLPGCARCRLHGGLSTGPRTSEGKARTVAALKDGRDRWLAKLKLEGKPIPCGRKKGGRNRSNEERERAAYEKRCARERRDALHQTRTGRKSRRVERRQERKVAADLASRRERFHAGLPFWTDEEWESL
jgi:hypothetical protein